MLEPVEQFKARVLKLKPNEPYLYYRGYLARDRNSRPDLNWVGMLAYGLYMIGKATLEQRKVGDAMYEYSLRLLRPIRNADFETGRKTYLKSLREE